MRKIKEIVLHCTATKEGVYVSLDTVRRWHMIERGWSDIGYHYLVLLDGTIEKGRPVERSGAHAKGHNKHSIGVAYVGGLDNQMNPKDTRTDLQKESLNNLLTELLNTYPESTLIGHNEVSSKACPSFRVDEVYAYLKMINE